MPPKNFLAGGSLSNWCEADNDSEADTDADADYVKQYVNPNLMGINIKKRKYLSSSPE